MQNKYGRNQEVIKRLSLSAFVIALMSVNSSVFGQAMPQTKILVVEPKVTGGDVDRATGFTLATPDGNCALLTAQHVNRRAMTQSLLLKDANYPQGFDATISVSSEEFDVLVSSRINGSYLGGCPTLPNRASVDAALSGSVFDVVSVSETGVVNRMPVRVTEVSRTVLTLRPFYPDQFFISGMSGAPLIADGRPIAMVQTTAGGTSARALRLDVLPGNVVELFASQPLALTAANMASDPYDVSRLPREIQDVVAKAREVRRNAEAVAVAARKVRSEAEDAAREARNISERNTVRAGYAWFDSSDIKVAGKVVAAGSRYAGQAILLSNGQITANGYGVATQRAVADLGNEDYCTFSSDLKGSCIGVGVRKFAVNQNNTSRWELWEGNFANLRMEGLGVLSLAPESSTAEVYMDRQYNSRGELLLLPAVWILRDGRRFEGTSSGNWDFGVLWNSDGSLRCFGYWNPKDGTVDHARNTVAKYPECK